MISLAGAMVQVSWRVTRGDSSRGGWLVGGWWGGGGFQRIPAGLFVWRIPIWTEWRRTIFVIIILVSSSSWNKIILINLFQINFICVFHTSHSLEEIVKENMKLRGNLSGVAIQNKSYRWRMISREPEKLSLSAMWTKCWYLIPILHLGI